MTDEILRMIDIKKETMKVYRRTQSQCAKSNFRIINNKLTKMVVEAKKRFGIDLPPGKKKKCEFNDERKVTESQTNEFLTICAHEQEFSDACSNVLFSQRIQNTYINCDRKGQNQTETSAPLLLRDVNIEISREIPSL